MHTISWTECPLHSSGEQQESNGLDTEKRGSTVEDRDVIDVLLERGIFESARVHGLIDALSSILYHHRDRLGTFASQQVLFIVMHPPKAQAHGSSCKGGQADEKGNLTADQASARKGELKKIENVVGVLRM